MVAEGVETDEQLQFLDAHGCDQVQGFRFSPPVPGAEIVELMRTPAQVFTESGREVVPLLLPISGISPARLEALLETIMLDRHWPSELDTEAIDAVLTALHADELTRVKSPRPGRTRSAKVAVSTLAGLASVSAGIGAAGAVGAVVGAGESVGATLLDEGTPATLAANAVPEPTDAPSDATPAEPDRTGSILEHLAEGQPGPT